MPVSPLEIDNGSRKQPKFPRSLVFVFVGLLIAAIGFQFMDVGRESRLYAPIRDRIGHLTSNALALHSSSVAALKNKFGSSSSGKFTKQSTVTRGRLPKDVKDRIIDDFPVTQRELPGLFNLILAPYGEEAAQVRVRSRPTLLFDMSFANSSSGGSGTSNSNSLTTWSQPPPPEHIIYPVTASPEKKKSKNSGKKTGRKALGYKND